MPRMHGYSKFETKLLMGVTSLAGLVYDYYMNIKSTEVIIPLSAHTDDIVPLAELQKRLEGMKEFNFWGVDDDCRRFAKTMSLWREKKLYTHFSSSWEDFVQEHVGKPMEWVEHIIQGVKILDGGKPVSSSEALTAYQTQRVIDLAHAAELQEPRRVGAPKKNKNASKKNNHYHDNNCCRGREQGSSPAYLTQRIATSHPRILQKMKQGEYSSVRAAAIDAGIVEQRTTFSVGKSTTPHSLANSLYERLGSEFVTELAQLLIDKIS